MMEMTINQHQQLTRQALRTYFNGGPRIQFTPLPQYRSIFVKNAKAASSTVLLWLHRIHTGDHDAVIRYVHADHGLPRIKDVGWRRILGMLGGDAFRFTFVRDPIARCESAYHNKILNGENDKFRAELRTLLGLSDMPGTRLTFDQFVDALQIQEPVQMNQHWRPQYLNLAHPLVSYDHIGKVEAFDRDLAIIREATGLPDVPFERWNTTKRVDSLFNGRPDLRRRVEQIYARDFELYGY